MHILLLFMSLFTQADCHQLSSNVVESVKNNTFKLVPRNTYAASIPIEKARELYEHNCVSANLTTSDKMNCEVLKTCTGEDCKIEFTPFGSAFLNQTNGLLYTAWHVVFPTHATPLIFMQNSLSKLAPEELNSTLSVLRPDFVLLDGQDNIVFDTNKQTALYEAWGNPLSTIYQTNGHKQHQPYGYFENATTDHVTINIGAALSGGLAFTWQKNKSDFDSKCLYSAGYQYHNGQFHISAGKKADVKHMQSQISYIVPFQLNPLPMEVDKILELNNEQILRLMGYSEVNIQKTLADHSAETVRASIEIVLATQPRHMRDQAMENHPDVLFFDAPVLPDQSGGAIIDENGTVVGITTNSFLDKSTNTEGHFTSYGAAGFFVGGL